MFHLLLTEKCNLKCPYCFADEAMDHTDERFRQISLENVYKTFDILSEWGVKDISYIGGEPTLHRNFERILMEGSRRGFTQSIFTNGIMSDENLEVFELYLNSFRMILININEISFYTDKQLERLYKFLDICEGSNNVTIGSNIYNMNWDGSYLIELNKRFNLSNSIRIGMTLPVVGEHTIPNMYIKADDYKLYAHMLHNFTMKCKENNLNVDYDCVLHQCMFSEEQIDEMGSSFKSSSFCEPIIDIGVDLDVYRCFTFSAIYNNTKLYDYDSVSELMGYYEHIDKDIIIDGGCMNNCDYCSAKDKTCQGGCLANQWLHKQIRGQKNEKIV